MRTCFQQPQNTASVQDGHGHSAQPSTADPEHGETHAMSCGNICMCTHVNCLFECEENTLKLIKKKNTCVKILIPWSAHVDNANTSCCPYEQCGTVVRQEVKGLQILETINLKPPREVIMSI